MIIVYIFITTIIIVFAIVFSFVDYQAYQNRSKTSLETVVN